jgi:hypothetical protein
VAELTQVLLQQHSWLVQKMVSNETWMQQINELTLRLRKQDAELLRVRHENRQLQSTESIRSQIQNCEMAEQLLQQWQQEHTLLNAANAQH